MNKIFFGDCRETMRTLVGQGVKAQMCVTSPPYFGLRDYGVDGQIGLEQTPDEYITALVEVFRCVRDVLADDGILWLNIGDSYSKSKQLLMIPARLAIALQTDGWVLRQEIIWNKTNAMPESVKDRCVASHEYLYLLAKKPKYYFDHFAIQEKSIGGTKGSAASFKRSNSKRGESDICPASPMATHREDRPEISYDGPKRNRRSVWNIATRPFMGAHFAVFPPALIEPCILAGSRPGDIVLDPFMGSGTVAEVALLNGRQYIGCELNQEYEQLQKERIKSALGKTSQSRLDLGSEI